MCEECGCRNQNHPCAQGLQYAVPGSPTPLLPAKTRHPTYSSDGRIVNYYVNCEMIFVLAAMLGPMAHAVTTVHAIGASNAKIRAVDRRRIAVPFKHMICRLACFCRHIASQDEWLGMLLLSQCYCRDHRIDQNAKNAKCASPRTPYKY